VTRGALVRWLQGLDAGELGEVLRRRPDALGAPSPGDLTQLAARLTTRTAVSEVVATLPLPALQIIEALATLGDPPIPRAALAAALARPSDDPELDAALRVLSQRALVWPEGDDLWTSPYLSPTVSPTDELPGDSLPFEPIPPAPSLTPADRAVIRTAAAQSADALLEHAADLLEEAAGHPLARQRNGGVAAREHARLATVLGLDEPLAAHFADVVLHAGLLGPDGVHLQPTTAATAWFAAPPAERLARLLSSWWSGPPLRRVVVRVLHDLPPDTAVTDTDSLSPLVRWTAPLPSRIPTDPTTRSTTLSEVVNGIVAEATLLGIVAMTEPGTFAISPLGRALADGRSVQEVAGRLLPEPPPQDPLKVYPAASVIITDDESLLDDVTEALNLDRVSPTVALSPEPLPATITALRRAGFHPERQGPKLTLHRTHQDAPSQNPTRQDTTSQNPTAQNPTAQNPSTARPPSTAQPSYPPATPISRSTSSGIGRTAPLGGTPLTGGQQSRSRPTVDPLELANRLTVPMQRDASPLEQINRRAPQLRPEQAQLLADAVEHGTPIWIRYVDANGRTSERVIENAELAGTVIEAWCRLRRDDRAFTLDKIVAVARPRH
jgi:hypothetical protein